MHKISMYVMCIGYKLTGNTKKILLKSNIDGKTLGMLRIIVVSKNISRWRLHSFAIFSENTPEETAWYQKLSDDCRPFVIFGDMETFKPQERRMTLQRVKAAKTAPKKWKEYGKAIHCREYV